MSDLQELYQQVIIDHGRKPRNFGELAQANHIKEGFNPLCGDQLKVYLLEKGGTIEAVSFTGQGCAISMASASIMTDYLKGKTLAEAEQLFADFQQMVTDAGEPVTDHLGKLAVLAGVRHYPMRVKCATLCWHTVRAAWSDTKETISTE